MSNSSTKNNIPVLPQPLTVPLTKSVQERIDSETVLFEIPFSAPTAGGGKYRIIVTNEMDAYDAPVPPGSLMSTSAASLAAAGGDKFTGESRRAAKLSIVDGQPEDFADLSHLIATLPSKQKMVDHQPKIKTTSTSNRVAEEKRNVKLRVWLYAASREDDNDFHLIFGREPGLTPKMYMTMELSGLPLSTSQHFQKLKAARDDFKNFFGDSMPGQSYQHYVPPIPVEIEGSLFFDMSHATGSKPGPKKLRDDMPTIWEVHPISSITFEP